MLGLLAELAELGRDVLVLFCVRLCFVLLGADCIMQCCLPQQLPLWRVHKASQYLLLYPAFSGTLAEQNMCFAQNTVYTNKGTAFSIEH